MCSFCMIQTDSDNLTPRLPKTAHSCNQHHLVTLGWQRMARQHYTFAKNIYSDGSTLSVVGSQYKTTMTVNKARKTAWQIPLHSIV